jgi:hypothetical protein
MVHAEEYSEPVSYHEEQQRGPDFIRFVNAPSLISALNDKFLKADFAEIANVHFFTRSPPQVSKTEIRGTSTLLRVRPDFPLSSFRRLWHTRRRVVN